MPTRTREIELRRQLASGDLAAAATLFDRYGGAMYAYARSLTANPADAEAAVIDAFCAAHAVAHAVARANPREHTTGLWLLGLVRAAAESRHRERGDAIRPPARDT